MRADLRLDGDAMTSRRIMIIGYGAIGAELATLLPNAGASAPAVGVMLRPGSASRGKVPDDMPVCETIAEVAEFAPNIVVEAAGHSAVQDTVPELLGQGFTVLVSSIGALHDEALFARLKSAAEAGGARLLLASGALGALDYVRASRGAEPTEITYKSRKPPRAWQAELEALGHDPSTLAAPVVLTEGTAREAAASYPQNLNVAAALALAGPGMDNVGVAVICDPDAAGNTHVVRSKGPLGSMCIEIVNQPSRANPKTSMIVARSLVAAIDQYFSPVQML